MKRFILPLFLLAFFTASEAQTLAKKYVLLEHFTNSKCSICASRNPAFYNLIGQPAHADDIHHISIHPPVPYNSCVFYLANPTENATWAALYDIQGTPRVAVNGELIPPSGALLPLATLQAELGQTSPLHVAVTETTAGTQRSVTITATALAPIPGGTYRLYAALAEKTINMVTSNGEAVHHDVFRKMLPSMDGEAFVPPAPGQSVSFTYNYAIAAGWNGEEIFTTAFIKNTATGEVLNSGTRFDAALVSATDPAAARPLQIQPNPAGDAARVQVGPGPIHSVEIYDLGGRQFALPFQVNGETLTLETGALEPGVYILRVKGAAGIMVGKMMR
jgi:hypothetical protein